MESPNVASMSDALRLIGQDNRDLMRGFHGFNAWAWPFRQAGEDAERHE
jgi:hypothetical protein